MSFCFYGEVVPQTAEQQHKQHTAAPEDSRYLNSGQSRGRTAEISLKRESLTEDDQYADSVRSRYSVRKGSDSRNDVTDNELDDQSPVVSVPESTDSAASIPTPTSPVSEGSGSSESDDSDREDRFESIFDPLWETPLTPLQTFGAHLPPAVNAPTLRFSQQQQQQQQQQHQSEDGDDVMEADGDRDNVSQGFIRLIASETVKNIDSVLDDYESRLLSESQIQRLMAWLKRDIARNVSAATETKADSRTLSTLKRLASDCITVLTAYGPKRRNPNKSTDSESDPATESTAESNDQSFPVPYPTHVREAIKMLAVLLKICDQPMADHFVTLNAMNDIARVLERSIKLDSVAGPATSTTRIVSLQFIHMATQRYVNLLQQFIGWTESSSAALGSLQPPVTAAFDPVADVNNYTEEPELTGYQVIVALLSNGRFTSLERYVIPILSTCRLYEYAAHFQYISEQLITFSPASNPASPQHPINDGDVDSAYPAASPGSIKTEDDEQPAIRDMSMDDSDRVSTAGSEAHISSIMSDERIVSHLSLILQSITQLLQQMNVGTKPLDTTQAMQRFAEQHRILTMQSLEHHSLMASLYTELFDALHVVDTSSAEPAAAVPGPLLAADETWFLEDFVDTPISNEIGNSKVPNRHALAVAAHDICAFDAILRDRNVLHGLGVALSFASRRLFGTLDWWYLYRATASLLLCCLSSKQGLRLITQAPDAVTSILTILLLYHSLFQEWLQQQQQQQQVTALPESLLQTNPRSAVLSQYACFAPTTTAVAPANEMPSYNSGVGAAVAGLPWTAVPNPSALSFSHSGPVMDPAPLLGALNDDYLPLGAMIHDELSEVCGPHHLAILLAAHLHSLSAMDTLLSASHDSDEQVSALHRLYSITSVSIGAESVCRALALNDGLKALFSGLQPLLRIFSNASATAANQQQQPPPMPPHQLSKSVSVQYAIRLLSISLAYDRNAAFLLRHGAAIYQQFGGSSATNDQSNQLSTDLRAFCQQITDWTEPVHVLKTGKLRGFLEYFKTQVTVGLEKLLSQPTATRVAVSNTTEPQTSTKAPTSNCSLSTIGSCVRILAALTTDANLCAQLYEDDIVSLLLQLLKLLIDALNPKLQFEETKLVAMFAQERRLLSIVSSALETVWNVVSLLHVASIDSTVFKNSQLIETLMQTYCTLSLQPGFVSGSATASTTQGAAASLTRARQYAAQTVNIWFAGAVITGKHSAKQPPPPPQTSALSAASQNTHTRLHTERISVAFAIIQKLAYRLALSPEQSVGLLCLLNDVLPPVLPMLFPQKPSVGISAAATATNASVLLAAYLMEPHMQKSHAVPHSTCTYAHLRELYHRNAATELRNDYSIAPEPETNTHSICVYGTETLIRSKEVDAFVDRVRAFWRQLLTEPASDSPALANQLLPVFLELLSTSTCVVLHDHVVAVLCRMADLSPALARDVLQPFIDQLPVLCSAQPQPSATASSSEAAVDPQQRTRLLSALNILLTQPSIRAVALEQDMLHAIGSALEAMVNPRMETQHNDTTAAATGIATSEFQSTTSNPSWTYQAFIWLLTTAGNLCLNSIEPIDDTDVDADETVEPPASLIDIPSHAQLTKFLAVLKRIAVYSLDIGELNELISVLQVITSSPKSCAAIMAQTGAQTTPTADTILDPWVAMEPVLFERSLLSVLISVVAKPLQQHSHSSSVVGSLAQTYALLRNVIRVLKNVVDNLMPVSDDIDPESSVMTAPNDTVVEENTEVEMLYEKLSDDIDGLDQHIVELQYAALATNSATADSESMTDADAPTVEASALKPSFDSKDVFDRLHSFMKIIDDELRSGRLCQRFVIGDDSDRPSNLESAFQKRKHFIDDVLNAPISATFASLQRLTTAAAAPAAATESPSPLQTHPSATPVTAAAIGAATLIAPLYADDPIINLTDFVPRLLEELDRKVVEAASATFAHSADKDRTGAAPSDDDEAQQSQYPYRSAGRYSHGSGGYDRGYYGGGGDGFKRPRGDYGYNRGGYSGKRHRTNAYDKSGGGGGYQAASGGTATRPRDIFRSRKPNTSRPPSVHVDDFVDSSKNASGVPGVSGTVTVGTASTSAPAPTPSSSSSKSASRKSGAVPPPPPRSSSMAPPPPPPPRSGSGSYSSSRYQQRPPPPLSMPPPPPLHSSSSAHSPTMRRSMSSSYYGSGYGHQHHHSTSSSGHHVYHQYSHAHHRHHGSSSSSHYNAPPPKHRRK